jgi:hypothetical protein
LSEQEEPLDGRKIEAMLAPLRKGARKRSGLRPFVVGLIFMAIMLIALVLSLPKARKGKGNERGGPVATCGNGTIEPGEDCEPPGESDCGADCLNQAAAPQETEPKQSP